jgi:hypothetical protein
MKTINIPDHFRTGSALIEFLAGRLGTPECWTNDCKAKATVSHVRGTQHVTRSIPAASPSLVNARWQSGVETLSGYALQKLRLELAPTKLNQDE